MLYGVVYVAPFYLSPHIRPSPTLSRDAPSVVRSRIRTVVFSCGLTSFATYFIVVARGHSTAFNALHIMGYLPLDVVAIVKNLTLALILYTGPLFQRGIVYGAWRDWVRGTKVREVLGGWIGWRNYVMVSPFLECI